MVQPDGTIAVSAPELVPGQRVTVSIETKDEAPTQKRRAADILAELPGRLQFQTAEEVDAYIREERDSWFRRVPGLAMVVLSDLDLPTA